jgi:uncharacterized protein (TIGR03382 family)
MRATILLLLTSNAFALQQKKHLEVSEAACLHENLPQAFCHAAAIAAYDVDADQFEDLPAHGQTPDGKSLCDGATLTVDRARALGLRIDASLKDGDSAAAAHALGQAFHLVQDVCTHSGMPNAQHAWWTDDDTCHNTKTSPDVQPSAFDCAAMWSQVVAVTFAERAGTLADVSSSETRIPPLSQLCDYLNEAKDWDGVDRRWNNDVVLPLVAEQLERAMLGQPTTSMDVCATVDISRAPDARVDTAKDPTCSTTDSLCNVANPSRGPNEIEMVNADGCQAAPGAPAASGLFILLALLYVRRRA